jgi:hypothetical protein
MQLKAPFLHASCLNAGMPLQGIRHAATDTVCTQPCAPATPASDSNNASKRHRRASASGPVTSILGRERIPGPAAAAVGGTGGKICTGAFEQGAAFLSAISPSESSITQRTFVRRAPRKLARHSFGAQLGYRDSALHLSNIKLDF